MIGNIPRYYFAYAFLVALSLLALPGVYFLIKEDTAAYPASPWPTAPNNVYTRSGIPAHMAGAFSNCPGLAGASSAGAATVDPASLRPCLTGTLVVTLQDKRINIDRPHHDYYMRVIDGTAVTMLTYYIGQHTLFAGVVREKPVGSSAWSEWYFSDGISTNSGGDGYQDDKVYQIVLTFYDESQPGSPHVSVPFAWPPIMEQIARG